MMRAFHRLEGVARGAPGVAPIVNSRRPGAVNQPFGTLLQVQRMAGNRAVLSLLRSPGPSATSRRGGAQRPKEPQIELGADVADAHRRGAEDAARITKAGKLSTADRKAVNEALEFFKGEARDEYMRQVKPVVERFAQSEHPRPATPPATAVLPMVKRAREAFVKNTVEVGSLSEAEANRAADAVELAVRGLTVTLAMSWFDYYAHHDLEKMSAEREQKALRGRTESDPFGGDYADTKPHRGTQLRSDVLSWPLERLGPLLFHELGHTTGDINWGNSNDWQEGHPYAVEFFLAGRTGVTDRQDAIVGLMRSGGICPESQRPAMQRLFRVTLATLISLQEVIEDSPALHLPANLRPDGTTARTLLDKRISDLEPDSDELTAITTWIERHLDQFDERLVPAFRY